MICGRLSAFGCVLLVGHAGKVARSIGDANLLPSIAVAVLDGTSIRANAGGIWGRFRGLLITLLQSILSVMQIAEFGSQII